MAGALKSMAAVRVAETELWRHGGDRSAAHSLARITGVSVSAASETLAAARRMTEMPAVAEAAVRGELSAPQIAAIADAAAANPHAAEGLVERASRTSLGELRDECARTKANVIDLEARRKRIHARRGVRTYTEADGTANLHWRDNPERIAQFMAELESRRDRLFKQARNENRREPLEAYAADAMVELSRSRLATKPSAKFKILVRVDLPALLRGYPVEDETCEIVGYGPVAVSAVRDLMDTGDPFLAAIATTGKQVMGVAHLGRQFTAHQKSALEWLYPTCAVEGCSALTYLEFDHRDDWAETHRSITDYADRPCTHHHHLKTRENWAFVEGAGKRPFVPPDDPRPPRNAHAPPQAARLGPVGTGPLAG